FPRPRRFTEPMVRPLSARFQTVRSFALAASLPRDLKSFVFRPASAVVALGLGGFLVDLLVRPVSTAGLLLILLAASPFLLELARAARPGGAKPRAAEPAAAPPRPAVARPAPAAARPAPRAPQPGEPPRPAAPR